MFQEAGFMTVGVAGTYLVWSREAWSRAIGTEPTNLDKLLHLGYSNYVIIDFEGPVFYQQSLDN